MAAAQVADRYLLSAKIGAGGFGEVYLATDSLTGDKVAVKLEPASCPQKGVAREVEAYAQLGAWPGAAEGRFPGLRWFGNYGEFRVLVSELLGPSLRGLFHVCGDWFSLPTVLGLAEQMLDCIERVHAAGLVHRDLKPGNFCVGLGPQAATVKLIDFGLAGRWQQPTTKQHIWYGKSKGWTGTVAYLSLNAHCRVQQSRRDDLESLGYILMHFLSGSLPWLRLRGENLQTTQRMVMYSKHTTPVETLCRGHPEEFAAYLTYCRGLAFTDSPDYAYWRSLFRGRLVREGYQQGSEDTIYDWLPLVAGGGPPSGAVPGGAVPGGAGLSGLGKGSSKNNKTSGTESTAESPACSLQPPACSGVPWASDTWEEDSGP